MRLRGVTATVLVGLAAAAAAGCSNGSPGPSATAPAPQATAPATGAAAPSSRAAAPATGATAPAAAPAGTTAPAGTKCANSPSAMVSRALGLAVGKVVASIEGPVTVCAYTGRYEVLVRYQTGENASQFALDKQSAARLHQKVSTVSGLGDEAFLAASPPNFTLAARSHNMAVFITAPAAIGSERALMVQLLEKT